MPADRLPTNPNPAAPLGADQKWRLHPNEVQLLLTIRGIRNGRLERLDIQNGLPLSAEMAVGRVRFDRKEGEKR